MMDDHLSDEMLDRYALGKLASAVEIRGVEEHLLSCPDCQEQLVIVLLLLRKCKAATGTVS